MTKIYYIWYGVQRFFRYFFVTALVGCVTFLPFFIAFILPTIIIMSFVLAIYDVILAKKSEIFLPSFSPMYLYLLSWGFTIAIALFIISLLIMAAQGVL
ncbi:MAG: hypothetical protein JJT82_08395 [Legionellaceae bacterium]|nr:hypothetical protein [Legionellaceae bacterium]